MPGAVFAVPAAVRGDAGLGTAIFARATPDSRRRAGQTGRRLVAHAALPRPNTKIRRQFSVATAKSGCVTRSCKPYIMR
ncbi:hypothetical protein OH687_27760 [Burkholderia anthina]|nr:hypothetical protein OH687_27760 [Burkholderia anthina]